MYFLANYFVNKILNMEYQYEFDTMNLVFDMVQKEKKSTIEIADFFSTTVERINSIYQAALIYRKKTEKKVCSYTPIQSIIPSRNYSSQ